MKEEYLISIIALQTILLQNHLKEVCNDFRVSFYRQPEHQRFCFGYRMNSGTMFIHNTVSYKNKDKHPFVKFKTTTKLVRILVKFPLFYTNQKYPHNIKLHKTEN